MKTIIFDFDGTLVDTLESAFLIYNTVAPARGWRIGTREELAKVRNLPLKEILKIAQVPFWQVPTLLQDIRAGLKKDLISIAPVSGMAHVLQMLVERGYRVGILSSNSEENIRMYLRAHQMDMYFSFVLGHDRLFGKAQALRHFLKANSLSADDVWYVGDEVRDIEASAHAGVRNVAVCWGFNTKEALSRAHPTAFADRPDDLLRRL